MKDISGNDGRTVLFVSHNMAAVKSLCTRGIVLENGTSVFEGTAEESVDYYLSSSEDNKILKVEDRDDRTGNGKVRLTNIKLLNRKGAEVNSVISGEFLRLKLFLDIKNELKAKFIVGLAFFDSDEVLKSMIVTDEIGIDLNFFLDRDYLNIDIPEFNLRGGDYYLRVVLSEGSTKKSDQLDNLDKAIQINVLPGDLYGIGKPNRSYNCSILRCKIN
jgi:lipopolysaccharide transport system ATP-binding protein